MKIFRAIGDFFKNLGCFLIGLIITVIIVAIGALVWFLGPLIIAGIAGLFLLLIAFSFIFGR